MTVTYNPNGLSSPVSVTTVAVEVAAVWGKRSIAIFKASAGNSAVIYLALDGTTASAAAHQVVLSAGEGLVLDGGLAPGGAISAIAASGTQSLAYVEG